jgi:hypothetical protein
VFLYAFDLIELNGDGLRREPLDDSSAQHPWIVTVPGETMASLSRPTR